MGVNCLNFFHLIKRMCICENMRILSVVRILLPSIAFLLCCPVFGQGVSRVEIGEVFLKDGLLKGQEVKLTHHVPVKVIGAYRPQPDCFTARDLYDRFRIEVTLNPDGTGQLFRADQQRRENHPYQFEWGLYVMDGKLAVAHFGDEGDEYQTDRKSKQCVGGSDFVSRGEAYVLVYRFKETGNWGMNLIFEHNGRYGLLHGSGYATGISMMIVDGLSNYPGPSNYPLNNDGNSIKDKGHHNNDGKNTTPSGNSNPYKITLLSD